MVVELILDDGTVDNGIGIGGDLEFIWVNRFTPDPGVFPFNLDQVQIYFDRRACVSLVTKSSSLCTKTRRAIPIRPLDPIGCTVTRPRLRL